MTGVVTATGNNTFFGRTAKLVAAAGATSHSQKAVLQIGDFLILVALALAFVLVGVEVYRRIVVADAWDWTTIGSISQFVLVLLVASIPVALPAVMSVTMAIGAYALSRQKAILSRLSAIEELAGVDVLCSDKTGTLTLNQLTVDAADPVRRGEARRCPDGGGARDADEQRGPDRPSRCCARSRIARASQNFKQTDFVPFDPVNKRTVATVVDAAGPPPSLRQGRAAGDRRTRQARSGDARALPRHGRRARRARLSGARRRRARTTWQEWQLLGLISLNDPPRPDAKATIAETERLGLNVKMVTGDDVAIGDQIAKQLGMGDHLLVASDVFKDDAPAGAAIPADVAAAVERADGFGRVFPQHKYEIVKSLQQRGHIVAMTGDGVNDAPALRQADCGIAVSGATDAARSAAALILTAPGLSTIVNAIAGARADLPAHPELRLLPGGDDARHHAAGRGVDRVLQFQPLTAVMIVVLALLDDIPIMTIAYDNVPPAPKPERWDMHRVLVFSCLMGLLSLAESFGLLLIGLEWLSDPAYQAAYSARPAKPADDGVPAIGGRRPSAAVRGAHAAFGVHAALSERAAVPRDRRHADRRGPDLRLRHSRPQASVGRGPRRLDLFAGLDGRHRPGEAPLLPRSRRTARLTLARSPPRSAADGAFARARWRSRWISGRSFCVKPGHKFKLADVDPAFHGRICPSRTRSRSSSATTRSSRPCSACSTATAAGRC